ncbi:hypothetical protein MKX01_027419 [Papaver californicum]|nr:hypothetical protein MKX01_032190 [Papaver californicum]KAI3996118.1 hypothetical protein MKX01_027419 [Papaver californicum]
MADDNSSTCNRQLSTTSTFPSLSPPSSQHKNVVFVHDHEQQQQQQHYKLLSNNFISRISKSCVLEVDDHDLIQKQYMFHKVVTPSDVGKLSRLVIPRQHAENYFPSMANNEKGLLLSFEDRNGKPCRFRYCYWKSSQSYVMTKGWINFVKEKRLEAGDIVYFGRGAAESYKDRYYIDWKHQPYSPGDLSLYIHHLTNPLSNFSRVQNLAVSSPTRDYLQLLPSTSTTSYGNYSNMVLSDDSQAGSGSPIIHDCQAHEHQYQQAGLMQQNYPGGRHNQSHMDMILNSVPVVHGKAAATNRVRLFGMNLECLVSEDA